MIRFTNKQTGEVWFEGVRVSNRMPCPICAGLHSNHGWCLLDPARGIAICPRVESVKRIGDAGWLHHLNGEGDSSVPIVQGRAALVSLPSSERPFDTNGMWSKARERAYHNPKALDKLASLWGVNREVLDSMEIGLIGTAWAFAMRDKAGEVCGIKLRTPEGKKLCVRGSRLGYISTYPQAWRKAPEVYVTEGESDLAAALTMGLPAIARPGCSSLIRFMPKVLTGRHVVIVRDNDEAGISGAALLRNALEPVAGSVVIAAPRFGKDLRSWLHNGGTADDMKCIVKAMRGW